MTRMIKLVLVDCEACKGSGENPDLSTIMRTCTVCNGSGKEERVVWHSGGTLPLAMILTLITFASGVAMLVWPEATRSFFDFLNRVVDGFLSWFGSGVSNG